MTEPTDASQPKRRPAYRFNATRQAQYLDLLRQGLRRGKAAEATGVTRQLVNKYIHENEAFAAEVDKAEMDAVELVEDALWKAATGGNVVAIQVWLYNRAPGRWADRRHVVTEDISVIVEQLADAQGMDPDEKAAAVAEADRMLREHKRRQGRASGN